MLSRAQPRPRGDLLVCKNTGESIEQGLLGSALRRGSKRVDRRRHQRIPQGTVPVNRDSPGRYGRDLFDLTEISVDSNFAHDELPPLQV